MSNQNMDNIDNNYKSDTELTIQFEQNNIKTEKNKLVINENRILQPINKKINIKNKFKYKKKEM